MNFLHSAFVKASPFASPVSASAICWASVGTAEGALLHPDKAIPIIRTSTAVVRDMIVSCESGMGESCINRATSMLVPGKKHASLKAWLVVPLPSFAHVLRSALARLRPTFFCAIWLIGEIEYMMK